ncbi:hypothetical protein LZ30DRAFT_307299 [Colletotrichum cereale]|nr:hypothetical protein LZ30DRAFT_307299 [Colletotrichum cereale]
MITSALFPPNAAGRSVELYFPDREERRNKGEQPFPTTPQHPSQSDRPGIRATVRNYRHSTGVFAHMTRRRSGISSAKLAFPAFARKGSATSESHHSTHLPATPVVRRPLLHRQAVRFGCQSAMEIFGKSLSSLLPRIRCLDSQCGFLNLNLPDESMDVAGFDSSPYAACQCDTRSPHDEDDGSWMDTLSDNESRLDIHDGQGDAVADYDEEVDSETSFTGDEDSRIDGTTDAEAAHDLADISDDESRDDVRSTVDNYEGDIPHTENPRLAVEAAATWDHQGHEYLPRLSGIGYSAVSPRCAEAEDICEEEEDAVETVETDDVPNDELSSTSDEPQSKNDGNSDKSHGGSYDDTSDDGDTIEASDDDTWSQHTEDEDVVFLYSADTPRAPRPVFRSRIQARRRGDDAIPRPTQAHARCR